MTKPLVSVIIVNWNGGEVFESCLKSLSKTSYGKIELIVVDNASTDGSEKLTHKYFRNSKVIKNESNLGFAPANNQGVKEAKGKYVLLLNNDTKVDKNFLNVLVGKMELDKDLGVVQPKILMMDHGGFLDNAGSFITKIGFLTHWGFNKKDSKEFGVEREVFSAKGACMLIRKSVIDKVGLFDKSFSSYFEESDFCWRVWLNGYRVLYFPRTYIYHKVGFTIKRQNVLNLNFHYYKNRIRSLIKNLGLVNLFFVLASHLFISMGIAFFFLVRGSLANFLMIFRAIFWNVFNIKDTLSERQRVQSSRKVNDEYVFKKVGSKIDFVKFFGDFKRVESDLRSDN